MLVNVPTKIRTAFIYLCAIFVFSFSNALVALPSDRNQEISISANSAVYKDNRGLYIGNVILQQGSLKIHADRLVIDQSNKKVSRVTATGKPATFEQKPNDKTELVTASAKKILYQISTNEIELLSNATIIHKGSRIRSEKIVYNAVKESVVAEGNASDSSKPGSKRVNMILQPNTVKTIPSPAP